MPNRTPEHVKVALTVLLLAKWTRGPEHNRLRRERLRTDEVACVIGMANIISSEVVHRDSHAQGTALDFSSINRQDWAARTKKRDDVSPTSDGAQEDIWMDGGVDIIER